MASLVKKIISTTKAPALGPYSQAVLVDRTMYVAGQIGLEPSTGQLVSGGAKEETKQALKNMGEILKAAGCDYGNVVKTTVLMADMKDYNDINDVYKQCFLEVFNQAGQDFEQSDTVKDVLGCGMVFSRQTSQPEQLIKLLLCPKGPELRLKLLPFRDLSKMLQHDYK